MKRVIRVIRIVLGIFFGILIFGEALQVEAANLKTIEQSPYVSFSPDGQAWTTNQGMTQTIWYTSGLKVNTGITSTIKALKTGEHYYRYERTGAVPVGHWKIDWPDGKCIHYQGTGEYHGIRHRTYACGNHYFSGWRAYCADCNDVISNVFIYMSKQAAESISVLPMGMDYFYLCPHCSNLEQGRKLDHQCKAVSPNRYKVSYQPNWPEGTTGSGLMDDSIHMYDDCEEYEGEKVTPIKHLSLNTYRCVGYSFQGWNTREDGSGTAYEDGEKILNLTTQNWSGEYGSRQGIIQLYAQWGISESTLQIDPKGGSFEGKREVTVIRGKYLESYEPNTGKIVAPQGYTVSFECNGGTAIEKRQGILKFQEWKQVQPFAGTFQRGKYYFPDQKGNIDVLEAQYTAEKMILPIPVREGYSFAGWYYDAAFQKPAGSFVIPSQNLTLYAQWADLVLTATDNYDAYDGKGAVDLAWNFQGQGNLTYRLYQTTDPTKGYQMINTIENSTDKRTVEYSCGKVDFFMQYSIPETGVYEIKLNGAQGSDYDQYHGGEGSAVTLRAWFNKSEILSFSVGGQDGTGGGGKGSKYGNGGGLSILKSDKKGLIAVAGGGGAASPQGNGGAGGSETVLSEGILRGEDGGAGGGAGYFGGKSGEVVLHEHDKTLCGYHEHQGDSENGGACFQKKITHVHTGDCPQWEKYYCGGEDKFGNRGWCVNCGKDESKGCTNIYEDGKCVKYIEYGCDAKEYYEFTCTLEEGYYCHMEEGEVVNSSPAYGGSSYVNEKVVLSSEIKIGGQQGDGIFSIESVDIGYVDGQELKAVWARDSQKPGKVLEDGFDTVSSKEGAYDVIWEAPQDYGTEYFHKAQVFQVGQDKPMCTSNVTRNTLTSGIMGYYYHLNNSQNSVVTKNHTFTENPVVSVPLQNTFVYLHVAAVDRAGNLGETSHFMLSTENVCWQVETKPLSVKEGENLFWQSQKCWYVRADGTTPFTLIHEALLQGPASARYQISEVLFFASELPDQLQSQAVAMRVEHVEDPGEEYVYSVDEIGYETKGELFLRRYPYSTAKLTEEGKMLTTAQAFIMDPGLHGQRYEIYPSAAASMEKDDQKKTVESVQSQDLKNAITLIADAMGPKISGTEGLVDFQTRYHPGDTDLFVLSAVDEESGLKSFRAVVKNMDSGQETEFLSQGGALQLNLGTGDPVYEGDFTVYLIAVDQVGNETILEYGFCEMKLEAKIERVLDPHEGPFKRGESGNLIIRAVGNVERIEIQFPQEFQEGNETKREIISYEGRQTYEQNEEKWFMVPLKVPADRAYRISVSAYKGNRCLQQSPEFLVIGEGETVLDELRTRLR